MDELADNANPATDPTVEGYELQRVLGRGAHSTVWLAQGSDGPVALKILNAAAGARGRRELATLKGIQHPHVVRLHAVTETSDQRPVLVLDYLSGGTLDRLVAARGPLAPGEVVTVLTPIAEALAELHRRGLVHGDLSPANIIFGQDGRPLLADLGVALAVGVEEREFGSPGFSDEHEPGTVADPADDVYGLAAIGAFALTGYPPPPAAVRPPLAATHPQIPSGLATVLDTCLDADRTARPSASELAEMVFDSTPSEAVLLVPTDPDADPVHVVTQQVRRRLGPEWEEFLGVGSSVQDEGVAGRDDATAAPAARRAFDRSQLRRAVEPAPRRRLPLPGKRVLIVATVVLAGISVGATAASLGVGRSVQPAASGKSTSTASTSAASTSAASASSGSSTASGTSTASGQASSEGRGQASSEAPSQIQSSAAPTADQPLAAVARLNQQRQQALSTRDRAALAQINAAGSPALDNDLAILDGLAQAKRHLSGLTFTLTDLSLVSQSSTEAVVSATTTTSAHDVLADDGTVIEHADAGAPRSILIKLARTGAKWQISDIST